MKKILCVLLVASVMLACERDQLVEVPNVEINIQNAREVVGDTLVFYANDTCRFVFQNGANNISFYSGEAGSNYAFRQRTRAKGNPTLNFTTRMLYGNQTNTLKLLAANNLPLRDSATIVSFDGWRDITDRAQWATVNSTNTGSTTVNAVHSGDVDLSDILETEHDSLIIAFKFIGTTGSTQKTWFITDYFLYNTLDGERSTVSSLSTDVSLWKTIRVGESSADWNVSTSQLRIDGGNASAPDNENWVVSRPIFINRVNPDTPTLILKNFNSPEVESHEHIYKKEGVYQATFVTSNVTADDYKERLIQFWIKILPGSSRP